MAQIPIAIFNASTVVTDAEVSTALPDFQTQITRDLFPAWGIEAKLDFVTAGAAPATMWWLGVFDDSDQASALGYHDLTSDGLPLSKVFARTDKVNGYVWTVTVSHELLEMLVDPDINLTVFNETDKGGRLYAYEVCDACEADKFGYKINSTLVSDFVYPAWFETFRTKDGTQFDKQSHMREPFSLLSGGYIGVYDVATGSGWTQLTKDELSVRNARAPVGSRRERRRTPRSQWLRSAPTAAPARAPA